MRDEARILAAAADPNRLAMLALAARLGRLCVCDFQGILGISQSATSRHLKTLREAGLLEDERLGAWVHYGPPARPGRAQAALLAVVGELLGAANLAALDEKVRAHARRGPAGCAPAEARP